MGDEHRADPFGLPDALELLLQVGAGERVEGAKRLVQEQMLGRFTSARAIAARWAMPPES